MPVLPVNAGALPSIFTVGLPDRMKPFPPVVILTTSFCVPGSLPVHDATSDPTQKIGFFFMFTVFVWSFVLLVPLGVVIGYGIGIGLGAAGVMQTLGAMYTTVCPEALPAMSILSTTTVMLDPALLTFA